MNMTVVKLTKLDACPEGIQYFKEHKFKTVEQAITEILKTNHDKRLDWSNWLISHSLSKMNCIRYAVYAAEQVIDIFEKKYPEDKRPRKAIQAAKRYLKNPTEENKERCKAASSAASDVDDAAAWTASWAAYAAVVARAASRAAVSAARAASWAASDKMFEKIIKYGVKLLNV
jgi:hypothetical protein